MNTNKILVIYTGGTIGMHEQDGFLRTGDDLIALMQNHIHANTLARLPEYDLINISPAIDSSAITVQHWQQLHQLIDKHYNNYCGFVILHGTDTMAYSASMLSFLLGGLDKSVIFTGAQIPLSQDFSDGEANLVGAMTLAAAQQAPEVGLFFNGKLLRGNCATKVSTTDFTAFKSHQYPLLAEINKAPIFYPKNQLPAFKYLSAPLTLTDSAVATLFLSPGINFAPFQQLVADKAIQGLILVSYGAGNIPDDNADLIKLLKTAQDNDIVVVNKSQCYHGAVNHNYAASQPLLDYGVLGAGSMTMEAVYSKLLYLFARQKDNSWVRTNFALDLRGEQAL